MAPTKFVKSYGQKSITGRLSLLAAYVVDGAFDPHIDHWVEKGIDPITLTERSSDPAHFSHGTVTRNLSSLGYSIEGHKIVKDLRGNSSLDEQAWRPFDVGLPASGEVMVRDLAKPTQMVQWSRGLRPGAQRGPGAEDVWHLAVELSKHETELRVKFGGQEHRLSDPLRLREHSTFGEIGDYVVVLSDIVREDTIPGGGDSIQGQSFDFRVLRLLESGGLLHPVASQFAAGIEGEKPKQHVTAMVDRVIRVVLEKGYGTEYSVDEDGALSFEALLANGVFIMCEVSLNGHINAGLYEGADGDLLEFLVHPTEEQLLRLFE